LFVERKELVLPKTTMYFLGLSSFEMLAMFRRGMFYAYLTIYLRHYLGLSVTATTLFATLPMLMNTFSQSFIWGRVSDRFQLRRSLIMAGELLGALGTLALWFLHRMSDDPKMSGYIIIAGLTCVELFWSMSNISWSALISDLYPEKERGRIQGRLSSMGGIGRMMGVLIGGLLYNGLNTRYSGWGFHQGALFFVAAGIMVASTLPLLLLPEGGISKPSPSTTSAPEPARSGMAGNLNVYLLFLSAMVLINFGRNSIAIIFPQYLSSASGLAVNSLTLSYILNIQSIAIICFGWFAGWICYRLGREIALLAGVVAAIAALLILWLKVDLAWITTANFLRGVGDAIIMAAAYEMASVYIPPEKRARWFAWFNTTFFLSWGLPGTLLVGPLVDFLIAAGHSEPWSYRASFAAAATLACAGLMVQTGLFLYRRRAASVDSAA
jgi:MFS family permease